MKLSQSQIQYLDNYVQKSGIKWFDLKIELTDHMIGKTEEILTRIPDLDFEEAVKKAKLTFGSKGFRPIILEKTKQIERQFYKDVFMHFKSFFTIPTRSNIWLAAANLILACGVVPSSSKSSTSLVAALAEYVDR